MFIHNTNKKSGFTLVELLIVIVVIAILAAITIVAYNGIQQRAHTTAQKSAAANLAKKVEAHNAINNIYPTFNSTTSAITGVLNSTADTSLSGSGITPKGSALTAAPASDGIVDLKLCAAVATLTSGTTVPTGFVVYIWDATQSPARAYATNAGGTTTIASGAVTNTGTYTCTSVS
jgi:prepilin-type N-terminal cleavage/methylation domain-containing protein